LALLLGQSQWIPSSQSKLASHTSSAHRRNTSSMPGPDSKTAGKWLFAAEQSICVEIDARAGGWFYIAGRRNGERVEYVGEYLEVVRPHRLVFALLAEKYSLNFERVTVVFYPRGIGCELSLTHETKPKFTQQARYDWAKVLERLAAMLSQTGRDAA
jgi:uncharacterized protein YndB with AHSA1/START domain